MLEKIFKDHDKWIKTVIKMGANYHTAEDVVCSMYVKIGEMLQRGLNIAYGDEVNYYYIYKTLRTLFLETLKHNNKVNIEDVFVNSSEDLDFEYYNNIVQEELDKMHWYNRKVFEMVQEGENISKLSRQTNIDYHSLYHTYVRVKNKLKKSILE